MAEKYVYVSGQDGEIYEICPTDGLLSFLQHLAEEEAVEQTHASNQDLVCCQTREETCAHCQYR